jgi:hypothetical protein
MISNWYNTRRRTTTRPGMSEQLSMRRSVRTDSEVSRDNSRTSINKRSSSGFWTAGGSAGGRRGIVLADTGRLPASGRSFCQRCFDRRHVEQQFPTCAEAGDSARHGFPLKPGAIEAQLARQLVQG